MKTDKFVEDVYNTLEGQLIEEACVPGVENLYTGDKVCMKWYADILDAYGRLCDRLGVQDEDVDVEIIIDSFLSICRETGSHMYHYGAKLGKKDLD